MNVKAELAQLLEDRDTLDVEKEQLQMELENQQTEVERL